MLPVEQAASTAGMETEFKLGWLAVSSLLGTAVCVDL